MSPTLLRTTTHSALYIFHPREIVYYVYSTRKRNRGKKTTRLIYRRESIFAFEIARGFGSGHCCPGQLYTKVQVSRGSRYERKKARAGERYRSEWESDMSELCVCV